MTREIRILRRIARRLENDAKIIRHLGEKRGEHCAAEEDRYNAAAAKIEAAEAAVLELIIT